MSITLGVRAHDYGRDEASALFGKISDDGWDCIQLAFKKAIKGIEKYTDINDGTLDSAARALSENRLTVGVFGAYIEPSLVDEAQRKAQVAEFIASLAFAKKLGPVCIGTETTNMAKQPGVAREEALKQLRKSLDEILPHAEDLGVVVAIEPVFYHALGTPELARDILKDIASPNLKIIYDPVNLLSADEAKNQHALWERSMECFGEKIAAVHMKGVRFEGDVPVACPFARSVVDYEDVCRHLRAYRHNLPVLREEAVTADAKADIEFLRGLF